MAVCFQNPGIVVVVLANAEHDVDTVAGNSAVKAWQPATSRPLIELSTNALRG